MAPIQGRTERLTGYSIAIDTDAPRLTQERLGVLLEKLVSDERLRGVAVNLGNERTPGVGAQLGLDAASPIEAATSALELFISCVETVGGEPVQVARVEVMTAELEERLLDAEPEGFAGVREVAAILGVRPQRVSQLRRLPGFPAPVVELAAGPVWSIPMLRRFVKGWQRKPGRPRGGSVR